ncbi:MAG TPA: FHA domain-containing protein [Anaerolineales bacterium]|nr:FHA domain-containing protein [Anaerolineales bacterium]
MATFRLTMQRGPNVGKSFEMVKDVMTMGRDMSNDIVINDAEASRHHARLTKQGSSYVIEDLGSTNGTFVNSARLSTPRTLSAGDVIGIGETISLNYESSATAPSGGTMVGNIDATVVASGGDMLSAKQIQEMASASASAPPEPVTMPMSQPSYDSSMPASSSSLGSDSLGKPSGGDNKMMYIGGGIAAFVLLCCCCPLVGWLAWTFLAPMLTGGF